MPLRAPLAVAGLLGGLLYGVMLARAAAGGLGTATTVSVFMSLGLFLGMAGGSGVSVGMAVASFLRTGHRAWTIGGAALGGMLVGAVADLLGLDAFTLLFGRSLAGITGAAEGALLGAALAAGSTWGGGAGARAKWRPLVGAGLAAGAVGIMIPLAGGHLFAGSLNNQAQAFADSRVQVQALGALFGDARFGTFTQAMLGGLEAMLFAVFVVGGHVVARQMHRDRKTNIGSHRATKCLVRIIFGSRIDINPAFPLVVLCSWCARITTGPPRPGNGGLSSSTSASPAPTPPLPVVGATFLGGAYGF